MNEVTTIHLGRQSCTIAMDARKELEAYLSAIKHQAGPNADEVLEEVELRMAELLAERGVTGDKDTVVLAKDIAFLKEQLGEPRDFKEDDSDSSDVLSDTSGEAGPKRLFRDPNQAWFAGVAAGISAYFGLPVMLIRALFVALSFVGGIGIVAYLLLWLVLPEAKSPADFLQMNGRAVTVDNIKEIMDRADVQGAAARASYMVGRVGKRVIRITLALLGTAFLLASLALLAGAITAASFLFMRGVRITNVTVFPLGVQEHYLVACALATAVLLALLLALTGRAVFARRWTFPAWATAAIVVCLVGAISVGTALGFAVQPAISQRYDRLHHYQVRTMPMFSSVRLQGDNVPIDFEYDSQYSVEIDTLGSTSTQPVATSVTNNVLTVNTDGIKSPLSCHGFCFGDENLKVIIRSPLNFENQDGPNGSLIFTQIPEQQPLTPAN